VKTVFRILWLCGFCVMVPPVDSAVINVPRDYNRIQLAVDASQTGDTIFVSPGVYFESVVVGKNIDIISTSGAKQTVINANGEGKVIVFNNGSKALLKGFSITGGRTLTGQDRGGGCEVQFCEPTISGCDFYQNKDHHIKIAGNPRVVNCRFSKSETQPMVFVDNGTLGGEFTSCLWDGGNDQMAVGGNATPSFYNCTFNVAVAFGQFSSLGASNPARPLVVNCVFLKPQANSVIFGDESWRVRIGEQAAINLRFNRNLISDTSLLGAENLHHFNLIEQKDNVFSGNPVVVVSNGNYHLGDNSPAINAGDNSFVTDPNATDMDGRKRILGGRVDLGAYERWSFYTESSLTTAEGTVVSAAAIAEDIASIGGVKFQVESGPEGLALDSVSGKLTWTPSEAQGPGTYTAVVRGTAANNPTATDTQTLTLTATEVNRAPEFAQASTQSTTERLTWTFQIQATDPDLPANRLTYRLVNGPTGVTIAADSGLLKWTPGEAEGGNSFEFVVEATDNEAPALSAQTTVRLSVQKVNHPPILAAVPNASIPESAAWTYALVGQDLDLPAQAINYSLVSGPLGVSVNPTTGVVQWNPTAEQARRTYPVTVRVTDSMGSSAERDFNIAVNPTIHRVPQEFSTIQQAISRSSDGDTIIVSAGLYNGPFIIDGKSILIIGDPSSDAIGQVERTVLDGGGTSQVMFANGSKLTLMNLTLKNGISSGGGALKYEKSGGDLVISNCWVRDNVGSGDITGAGIRVESASVKMHKCRFSNNKSGKAGAGLLSWCPSAQIDQCVFDGNHGEGAVFMINGSVPDFRIANSIFINNSGGSLFADMIGWWTTLNQRVYLNNTAFGQGLFLKSLIYSSGNTSRVNPVIANTIIGGGMAALGVERIDGAYRKVEVSLVNLLVAPGTSLASGILEVLKTNVISVDPKFVSPTTGNFRLRNDSLAINAGDNSFVTDPNATDMDGRKRILGGRVDLGAYERWSFYTESSLRTAEGTVVSAAAIAEDIASIGGVKFQVESGPEGLALDSVSGKLTWTPSEAQGPGTYTAVIRGTAANNPSATDTQTLTLTATEVNRAPEFASANVQTTTERLAWAYTAAASDPDLPANRLAYRLVSGPSGATIADDSGLLKWTPGEAEGGNSYDFVVEATDNGTPALSAQTTVRLDVQKINHPPTLASLSNRAIPENQPWTAQAVGQDLDLPAQSVTYSVQSGPSGLAVDSSTGVIRWAPSEAQGPGQYPVTVRVQDPEGLSAEQTFELSVTEVNTAPSLAALPHQMLTYGQTLSLQWAGSDTDLPANALSYRLVSGPTNAVVSTAGQLMWTPSRAQAPSTNVLVVAVSDGSLSATNTVRVEVLDFITLMNGTETTNALALLPPAKVSFKLSRPDWVVLYSLDGTQATDTSLFYLDPFTLDQSATVWPIAFSPDFSQSVVGLPIRVNLLRSQTLTLTGGQGLVHQGPGVAISAASDSGLSVTLSVVSGPARLENGLLIPTGGGVVRLKATQAGNADWAPASLEFERTVAKAVQAIAWTPAPESVFRSAPVQLKAMASSGLAVTYSVVDGPGSITADRLTLTGAGQVVVRATQAGTSDFEPTTADQTVTVKKAAQTLTFNPIANRVLGADPVTLAASASSSLGVVYEVLAGPAKVAGDQLTVTGVGVVVVRASQLGNANYEPALPKDQQFTVTQGQQRLTFAPVGSKTFGDGLVTLVAASSAKLPITYRVVSGPGALNGDQLTLLGAGDIVVQASQGGNDQFQAVSINQTITVAKAAQAITFPALPSVGLSTNGVALDAKAGSGLAVSYRLIGGNGTITGSKLALTGIGSFTIAADQAGNTNWLAATSVTNSFAVTRGVQTIAFAPIGDQVLSAGTVTLNATSSAGLSVTYTVMSGPATVSGGKLTLLNEGTVVVRAINPGSTLWQSAQAEQTFQVRKLTTLAVTIAGNIGGSVALAPLKDQYTPTDTVTLTATATNGFAFAGWSGDLTGLANPATLTMSSVRAVIATFKDIQPPVLTWDLPATGTTGVEQVRLSGQITDNVGVTVATWSRDGGTAQAISVAANGTFSVDNLVLMVGTNRFAIVARDAAGNETKLERQVVWLPQRVLSVGDAVVVLEGQRLVFPLNLTTDTATVAGLTFKLTYDPAWVADPQVEWGGQAGQSVNNVNLGTAGELTGSFALAGVGLPSGSNRVATVSFRARSVPAITEVIVRPTIVSLGSLTGVSLNQGNAAVSGLGTIRPRRIRGDNNANQRLDVGDAVLISRYEVGLEEKRSWDIGLNDLNQSGTLDNGDVIKALRTVVGLDPQPSPGSEGKRRAGSLSLADALGLAKVLVNTNDVIALDLIDGPTATVGQPYRVAVKLNRVKGSLSGLSFALKYPASLSLTDKQVGALVPGDALPFWNESAGQVSLAAIRSTAWANATGVAAVLTFVPSAGFSAQAEWPLKLEQVEITGSGFDVRPVDPVSVAIQSGGGTVNTPPQIALQPPGADGSLTLEIRAAAGATVALEATGDLNTWIESQRITGQGDSTPVKVTLKPDPTVQAKFWRVRVR
jgi:hypothetical protein